MPNYPSKPPLKSGQPNSVKNRRASSNTSAPPPAKFAGKRLENYSNSFDVSMIHRSTSAISSEDEFAIADSNESNSDRMSSEESDDDKQDKNSPKLNSNRRAIRQAGKKNLIRMSKNKIADLDTDHSEAIPTNIAHQLNISSDSEDSETPTNADISEHSSGSNEIILSLSKEDDEEEDSEDVDGEDYESDSSIDSATFFLSQFPDDFQNEPKTKVKPPQKLEIPVPKRIDLPAKIPKAEYLDQVDRPTSLAKVDKKKRNDSSSDLSVISDDSLDALEASISRPIRRTSRRPSIVDSTLDEKTVFPRSSIAQSTDRHDSSSEYASGEESEYNDENLLAILSDAESSVADHEESDEIFDYDDEADDEDVIEESEERAILEEVKRSGDLEEPLKVGYESDEESESDVSFSQDPFFDSRTTQAGIRNITSVPQVSQLSDEDDDSYLWSYFFTSGDESDGGNVNDQSTSLANYELPKSMEGLNKYSGDSTDEDDTLPRNNVGKKSRPTEILSTSATTSRPPVLGSWVMSSERPYGIIDGLTTRTLSPPSLPNATNQHQNVDETDSKNGLITENSSNGNQNLKRQRSASAFNGFTESKSDSELSELALDDFIYTSELEDKDDQDDNLGPDNSAFEETSYHSFNKNIPLSAFRNRAFYSQPSFQQTIPHHRKSSIDTSRPSDSLRHSKEIIMTPVKSMPKHFRKRRKHSKKSGNDLSRIHLDSADMTQSANSINDHDPEEFGTTDLIEELIGIGALSPLFGGLG